MLMPFSTRMRKTRSSWPSLGSRRLTPSALNDPQPERLAMPDRFRRQAPHQYDGEHVTVLRDPLDQLIQRGFDRATFSTSLFLVMGFASAWCSIGRSGILVPFDLSVPLRDAFDADAWSPLRRTIHAGNLFMGPSVGLALSNALAPGDPRPPRQTIVRAGWSGGIQGIRW